MLFLSICVLLKIFSSIFSTLPSFRASVEGCQCVAWSRCEFSPEPHAALWCYATGRPPIRMAHIRMAHPSQHRSFCEFSFLRILILRLSSSLSLSVSVYPCAMDSRKQKEKKPGNVQWTVPCAMDSLLGNPEMCTAFFLTILAWY